MSWAPMKNIPISNKNDSEDNIDIRQVGKNQNPYENPPSAVAGFIAVTKAVSRKTNRCTTDWQRRNESPISFRERCYLSCSSVRYPRMEWMLGDRDLQKRKLKLPGIYP